MQASHSRPIHAGASAGIRRRALLVSSSALIGFISGCASGYLWLISPNARHYPGPVFGVALALIVLLTQAGVKRLWSVVVFASSVLAFYLAVAIMMETGLPQWLDRGATLTVGVLPIAFAVMPMTPNSFRWKAITNFILVSIVGGIALKILSGFRVAEPTSFGGWEFGSSWIVFECLRFAAWQTPVAMFVGFCLSSSSRPTENGE